MSNFTRPFVRPIGGLRPKMTFKSAVSDIPVQVFCSAEQVQPARVDDEKTALDRKIPHEAILAEIEKRMRRSR